MTRIKQFQHVGLTVSDLDEAAAFFTGIGLEVEGRTFVEGEFLDTVSGIPDSRVEVVMLRPPGGGVGIELAAYVRPEHTVGTPAPMSNELGIRNVCFEVDDLPGTVDRLAGCGGVPAGRRGR